MERRAQVDAENRVVNAIEKKDLEEALGIVITMIDTIYCRDDFDNLGEPVRSSIILASETINRFFNERLVEGLTVAKPMADDEEQDAEDKASEDWERGREAGWDDWEEIHYGGAQ